MKVTEAIQKKEKKLLSLEIVPPSRGFSLDEALRHTEQLMAFHPDFINVTAHQPYVALEEKDGEIVKLQKSKKCGTVGVCSALKTRLGVEAIPHVICGGDSLFEIEDKLIDLNYLGFDNLFIVRGDPLPGQRTFIPPGEGHEYASGLVRQARNLNEGLYSSIREKGVPTDFCIGVAGYPEKHYESLNKESDLNHLAEKIEAGAHFIITQMLFSAQVYTAFVSDLHKRGLEIPVIPGIKPVTRLQSLKKIPGTFHIDIPQPLVTSLEEARTPAEEAKAGTGYMARLINDLLEAGAPGIHIFTMGSGKNTQRLLETALGHGGI
jgi:methylenetetrahydrofolate reductase (NADPH)